MKPQVVGSACHRVQIALDEALSEGALSLSAELAAHAALCPRCRPEWKDTEELLIRLRDAAAGIDLGRVPGVVDRVMAETAAKGQFTVVAVRPDPRPAPDQRSTGNHARWILGQVAAVAAVVLLTTGVVTYGMLKVNEAVSGVKPGDVLARLAAPFRDMNTAQMRSAK